ncbi:BON domain-containing protein [Litorilinea aerophila]|nr:BON domain-containing protein [Litorilinea aerophila]MCC9077319.1 BON domain-containing protein [Litorilinea aerophila]OUC08511.1 hypothetical protein RY27_08535 [Litorilinea aerophila]GIV79434.1 MAG: hypothetical protein KatS3mg050_3828 [Litorilinea sp.]
MVRVGHGASDLATAWRVRDALAAHPLLGGATAQIQIVASRDSITLEGWAVDERVRALAVQLALRAAGRRPVYPHLRIGRAHDGRPTNGQSPTGVAGQAARSWPGER